MRDLKPWATKVGLKFIGVTGSTLLGPGVMQWATGADWLTWQEQIQVALSAGATTVLLPAGQGLLSRMASIRLKTDFEPVSPEVDPLITWLDDPDVGVVSDETAATDDRVALNRHLGPGEDYSV